MKENLQEKNTVDYTDDYPIFTADMKRDYTILIPDMPPWHFDLLLEFDLELWIDLPIDLLHLQKLASRWLYFQLAPLACHCKLEVCMFQGMVGAFH